MQIKEKYYEMCTFLFFVHMMLLCGPNTNFIT